MQVTVEELCQWLLKNCASDCWRTVQRLLNNRASDCWTVVPLTVEQLGQYCGRIMSVTVEELCQRLLNNPASSCWKMVLVTYEKLYQCLLSIRTGACKPIVPTSVEQSCLCFFLSFLITLTKSLPVFLCKYFDYY